MYIEIEIVAHFGIEGKQPLQQYAFEQTRFIGPQSQADLWVAAQLVKPNFRYYIIENLYLFDQGNKYVAHPRL
jgi:hypothetical protein